MSDRFPYNLPSREALCVEVRKLPQHARIEDRYVTFEDMIFSPTQRVPGRTYIEMVDLVTSTKSWHVYRRLDLSIALEPIVYIAIIGDVTPKIIAEELNRSRGMTFGPDDLSFSNEYIYPVGGKVEYELEAMVGSYAYYGQCTLIIDVFTSTDGIPRIEEDGDYRLLEDGTIRLLE